MIKTNRCKGMDETEICPFGHQGQYFRQMRCSECFQRAFPHLAAKRKMQVRSKELKVKFYIEKNYNGFLHDKAIWTNHCDCSVRRRIDLRKTFGNTMLCIEIDEEQHKTYDEKDQEARLNDLYMAQSGKFIYIRINPDRYKNHDGIKRNPKLEDRFPRLKQEVDKQVKRINDEANTELVEEVYLFFDNFDDSE